MKKLVTLILTLLLALTLAVPAMSEALEVGQLVQSNQNEAVFNQEINGKIRSGVFWLVPGHEIQFRYFDDLNSMLMALDAGTIDEITLPRFAAEYIAGSNPEFEVCCAQSMNYDISLVFGFVDDEAGRELQGKINEAIASMKADGTLDVLTDEYLSASGDKELKPVQFDAFPDSDASIRVIVTGDLPPIDYIGADGVPAGFNTAVLAEVGRRLGVNIEPISAHTSSRTLALTSHTADAVFWYMDRPTSNLDQPDGLVFSDPYLSWDLWLHIRKTAE